MWRLIVIALMFCSQGICYAAELTSHCDIYHAKAMTASEIESLTQSIKRDDLKRCASILEARRGTHYFKMDLDTALLLAAQYGSKTMCEFILQQIDDCCEAASCNIYSKLQLFYANSLYAMRAPNEKENPLFYAVERGNSELVALFLEHGGFNHHDCLFQLVFRTAVQENDQAIIAILIKYGAWLPLEVQVVMPKEWRPSFDYPSSLALRGHPLYTYVNNFVREKESADWRQFDHKAHNTLLRYLMPYYSRGIVKKAVDGLLELGASPYASCPGVHIRVAMTIRLAQSLRSNRRPYDELCDIFEGHVIKCMMGREISDWAIPSPHGDIIVPRDIIELFVLYGGYELLSCLRPKTKELQKT